MLAQIFSWKIKQKNKRNPLLCDKVLITTKNFKRKVSSYERNYTVF